MRAVICQVVHLSVLLLKSVLPPFHSRRQCATGKNGSFDALRLLRMTRVLRCYDEKIGTAAPLRVLRRHLPSRGGFMPSPRERVFAGRQQATALRFGSSRQRTVPCPPPFFVVRHIIVPARFSNLNHFCCILNFRQRRRKERIAQAAANIANRRCPLQ